MDLWSYLYHVLTHLDQMDLLDALQYFINEVGNLTSNDLVELFIYLGLGAFGLYVGFLLGTYTEIRHYQSIRGRETQFRNQPLVTSGLETMYPDPEDRANVVSARLVAASVVISEDYFKTIVALLRKYFGGNLTTYESLLDRARREAFLRLKESAPYADIYVNLRMETPSISKEGEEEALTTRSVEVLAYATAITFQKTPETSASKAFAIGEG